MGLFGRLVMRTKGKIHELKFLKGTNMIEVYKSVVEKYHKRMYII